MSNDFNRILLHEERIKKGLNIPHEADKDKVRENIEKINKPNSLADAIKNLGKALVGDDIEHDAYKRAALQVISDLKNEIKAKDTEIQGLKCELEGLKVENARLQGNVDGLTTKLLLADKERKENVKESIWKRIFG